MIELGDTVKVDGYSGVAWRVREWAKEYSYDETMTDGIYNTDDVEEYDNTSRAICVMVGDDRRFEFDVDELTKLDDDAYCPECGQTSCSWGNV